MYYMSNSGQHGQYSPMSFVLPNFNARNYPSLLNTGQTQLFISRAQCAQTAVCTAKGFTHPYTDKYHKSVTITPHRHQLTTHEWKCVEKNK